MNEPEDARERVVRTRGAIAVDASLLVLLRNFSFDDPESMDVFMVDFSGRSVAVSVTLDGKEKISVPAGEFECFRMKAEVRLPVFRLKVLFWIAVEEPYFMVKHRGQARPVHAGL